jgi:hypothetical protein
MLVQFFAKELDHAVTGGPVKRTGLTRTVGVQTTLRVHFGWADSL